MKNYKPSQVISDHIDDIVSEYERVLMINYDTTPNPYKANFDALKKADLKKINNVKKQFRKALRKLIADGL